MQSVIQHNWIGRMGRFANQLHQALGIHFLALKYNAEPQLAKNPLDNFFIRKAAHVSHPLPSYTEQYENEQPVVPGEEVINKAVFGWLQYHTSHLKPYKAELMSCFEQNEYAKSRIVIKHTGTVVGIHIRRGDFTGGIFWPTPVSWYLAQLEKIYSNLNNPILVVATEDRSILREFSKYKPLTADDFGLKNREKLANYNYLDEELRQNDPKLLDFWPDFSILLQSDVILGGNSTFSFAAALLNEKPVLYYRATLSSGGFELTDPWDAYPHLKDKVESFPHLGIR